jgi:hypothetical protein
MDHAFMARAIQLSLENVRCGPVGRVRFIVVRDPMCSPKASIKALRPVIRRHALKCRPCESLSEAALVSTRFENGNNIRC